MLIVKGNKRLNVSKGAYELLFKGIGYKLETDKSIRVEETAPVKAGPKKEAGKK